MKSSEKGFTILEILISVTIMALAAGAASIAIFQIMRNTERNSDQMTVVRQVENAGYWISQDTQMALNVTTTDNLTSPNFLRLQWTTWNGTTGNPVYHSAEYYFENLTDGVGTLKRNYQTSDGANRTNIIAQYIYYDPDDAVNSSNVSYQSPVLTVKIVSRLEDNLEIKEYKIQRRPNL